MSKKLYPDQDIADLVDADINHEETFFKGGVGSGIKGHKTYQDIPIEKVKEIRQQYFDTGKSPAMDAKIAHEFAVRLRNNGYPVKEVASGNSIVLVNPSHHLKSKG